MLKDVLLYYPIYDWTSADIIRQMDLCAQDGSGMCLRVNCDGGDPLSGWGVIAKFAEFTGEKKIKVDGKAYSMAAYALCYADDVECLDVSEFIIHRAAYSRYFENNPELFTAEAKESLNKTNKKLRAALEAKIDVAKFEQLKGVKLNQLFSLESRIDVQLDAKEAKAIGLVDRIVKITPQKKAEINSLGMRIAARYIPVEEQETAYAEDTPTPSNQPVNKNTMTIEELKASHPALYKQVVEASKKEEADRIGAWMVFADVDMEACKKGIADGSVLSATQMAEFNRKAIAAQSLKGLEAENAAPVSTKADAAATSAVTTKPEVAAFEDNLKKMMNKPNA